MLDAIIPFVLIAILVIGWLMDKCGYVPRNQRPDAVAARRERVRALRDERYASSIEAEARAIVSREQRAVALQAAVEAARNKGSEDDGTRTMPEL